MTGRYRGTISTMRPLVVALGLLLFGCTTTPEQKRRDVCTAFCDCVTGTPSALERCITDDCFPILPPAVSDPCLDCVYTNSQACSALFSTCESLCFPGTPRFGGI